MIAIFAVIVAAVVVAGLVVYDKRQQDNFWNL